MSLIHNWGSLITVDQKKAIFERLLHRNAIRAELGIRPMNIPDAYKRQTRFVVEKRYDEIMAPLVDAVFSVIDWPPGMDARRCVAMQSYQQCIDRCEAQTGYSNPCTGAPDLKALITRYADKTLKTSNILSFG
jgi:hypothetical protein